MDKETKELIGAQGAAIVPRSRRKAVYRANWHTPYHSRNRYSRL